MPTPPTPAAEGRGLRAQLVALVAAALLPALAVGAIAVGAASATQTAIVALCTSTPTKVIRSPTARLLC